MMELRIAAKTDVGRVRAQNEDGYLTALPLVAVADGMGGHRAGEVASKLALEFLDSWSAKDGGPEQLREAVVKANQIVWSKGQEDRSLQGMGTTLTAAWIVESEATFAHVGDSRAYLLRSGALSRLTQDHTLVKQWENEGRIEPGEADHHPQRNILTQAIGVEPEVDVEVLSVELQKGDRLLLATDGLHGQLPDDRIRDILTSTEDPDAACRTLVEEANAAGGEDNITVVLLDAGQSALVVAAGDADAGAPPVIISKPSAGAAPARRRRRRRLALAAGLATVAVLVAAAAFFFLSSGPGYVVGVSGDRVAILEGSKVLATTDRTIADVPESFRGKLRAGIPVGSLAEGERIVRNLPKVLGPTETPTPSPPPPPVASPVQ